MKISYTKINTITTFVLNHESESFPKIKFGPHEPDARPPMVLVRMKIMRDNLMNMIIKIFNDLIQLITRQKYFGVKWY